MPESAQPLSERLWSAFSSAQAVDWQAVFEQSPLDRLGLPLEAERTLESLLDRFHRYDFSLLKEDVIGQIMEGLIPPEERHALGQYFTREDLVDFILGFVADDPEKSYLDPTCGSGTFLNRLYSRLRWRSQYRASHAHLLERLWGVDIAHFPAELATINLFRQDVRDVNNFPRILVRDFFRIQPQQTFEFPPPQATALDYRKVRIPMPRFHGIVGNFPYIRQELIEDKSPGYKQTIVQTIAREWFWKDPYLFEIRGINKSILEKVLQEGPAQHQGWLDQQVQKGRVDLRLSGQADIYAYLFYHAAAFLEEGGRLGIVTSNAWLDVAYGAELKRFFLRHFKIVAVVASWCEPWFEDADINTAFVILERCEDAAERARNVVRFVKVKKPLADLLPGDLLLRENDRWRTVDALVREIETADAQIAAWDPITGQVQPLHGVHTVETGNLRIRLVPQAELERELESRGETAKWGLYIRAPQVYFDLLEKAGDRLVPLNEVAEVRRGYTTGINEFFYLKPLRPGSEPGTVLVENERKKNAPKWVGEIEEECLQPVIRSPKESPAPSIDPNRLRYRLFLPPYINQIAEEMVEAFREELKNKKLKREDRRRREREFYEQLRKTLEQELQNMYPLAYAYVRWGESQRTSDGRLWSEVPSVQGRWVWWLVREATTPDGMWPKAFNDRFLVADNSAGVASSDRFYEIVAKEGVQRDLLMAILNSTIVALIVETNGRVNLGEGALDNMVYEAERCMVPNPHYFGADDIRRILSAYNKLKNRPVRPIAEEVHQRDRRALDRAVLEALGLDPEEYLPQIYQGLVEMVRERLALPEMRTTRRQQVRRMSLNQIKEKVRQEVLPGGLKSIAACLPTHPKPETRAVPLTGRPVQWRFFLNQYTFIDPEGNEVGEWIGEEVQARYVLYAWKPGHYRVEVPADPIVAGKAVQQYEQDLRQTADEIFQRLLEAIQDYRLATRATEEILESLGLPPLAVARAMGDR
jgi:type I restriction enzyme M protein